MISIRQYYLIYMCIVTYSSYSTGAHIRRPLTPTFNRNQVHVLTPKQYLVGAKGYVPTYMIRPGQMRIARAGVNAKVKEAQEKGYIDKNKNLAFNAHTSIIAKESPLPVVMIQKHTAHTKYQGKKPSVEFVLIDGHHDFGANTKVGGSTVYIEIKDDFTNVPAEHVWQILEQHGYIYPYRLNGKKEKPIVPHFAQLEDDPYRYFVKLAMWESPAPTAPFANGKKGTKNLQYPLAVKWKNKQFNPYIRTHNGSTVMLNPAFIEFKVADILYENGPAVGFDYKPGDESDKERFNALVEKARFILKRSPAQGFNLIPTQELAQQLIESETINAYTYE